MFEVKATPIVGFSLLKIENVVLDYDIGMPVSIYYVIFSLSRKPTHHS